MVKAREIRYNIVAAHEAGHAVMALKYDLLSEEGITICSVYNSFSGRADINLDHFSGQLSPKRLRQACEIWSGGLFAEIIYGLGFPERCSFHHQLDILDRTFSYNDLYMSTHSCFGLTDGINNRDRFSITCDLYYSICLDVKEFLCKSRWLVPIVKAIKAKGIPDHNKSVTITRTELVESIDRYFDEHGLD